jgi:hypothetical protein
MGYQEPLPVPSLAVQATVASIIGDEIHEFVQTSDQTALQDKGEDGEHAPLLISALDLSNWKSLLFVSTQDDGVEKAMGQLREVHGDSS